MAETKVVNSVFTDLVSVNVNDHVEKKNTGKVSLSYLSWSWAWSEVKKRYPNATYEIVKFENGLPYCYDPKTGYMVYTKVTIENVTHEMWLPVMDSHNEAMLDHSRVVKTKYSEYTVAACTMFDVNKTIMRCLTKNLAMFGLGLYIYSGEDLPEDETKESKSSSKSEPFDEAAFNNVVEKLKNFDWIIPADKTANIKKATDEKNLSYLKAILSWCESEAKKEEKKAEGQ